MNPESIAFTKNIAALSPRLIALIEDHLRDNFGEMLPHLFLGDVADHVVSLSQAPSSDDRVAALHELRAILDAIETGYATGPPDVQELIAASFLENLPTNNFPGSEVRKMLGPALAGQLKFMT